MGSFGGALSVVADGKVLVESAGGIADPVTGTACTADTCFRACSAGKQFVAAAAMLLHEAGRLDLHAPIGRYVTRRPQPASAPEPSSTPQALSRVEIPSEWRELTTHHLLTHTAGFGHWRHVEGFDPLAGYPPAEIIARRARRPLLTAPGTEFAYSGVGYLLAAYVVESVSGQTYQDFTTERIFAPLGMHATRAGADAPGPAAIGTVDGRPVDVTGLAAIPGTGALWTTVRDLARFARAFASDELLRASSRELMSTPHVPVPAADGAFGETAGYGYGYFVGSLDGHAVRYHTGDIPGYRSMYVDVPGLGASISVLSNRDETDARGRAAELWRTVLLPAADPASAPAPIPTPAPAATSAPNPAPRRWELWRQDDNGNRYLVSGHPDEDSARARLAAFESGVVHKQTYWITPT